MATPETFSSIKPRDVVIPNAKALADRSALRFQVNRDPKNMHAQTRFIGTGATRVLGGDNMVPGEHFTFSTMVLPAPCEGSSQVHRNSEEAFFIPKGGKGCLSVERLGEKVAAVPIERDIASVPAGAYCGLHNNGFEEALMFVTIASLTPVTHTYSEDHLMATIKR